METRACGETALHFNGSPMFADNPIRDRKAQPGSLPRALGSKEWIVDPLEVLGRDSLAIVTYIDARKSIRVPGLDGQPGGSAAGAALLHGVARIEEQV